jgi:5'-methylthioadenosine phosphorylase
MIGIIGGSGLYEMEELDDKKIVPLKSIFGEPSSSAVVGSIANIEFAFLPRHGLNHELNPSEINYRANIEALKRIGVEKIISISAVGSLKEEHEPGKFVVIDQYIDRTYKRKSTFFEGGCVAHVPFGDPVCDSLSNSVISALQSNNINHVNKGTYICIEGPQFSTRAESELYRSWGCDVIGMTNLPEAKLAREAGICYTSLAMVTDYDCWHSEHEEVTIKAIQKIMKDNISNAHKLIKSLPVELNVDDVICNLCATEISNVLMSNSIDKDQSFLDLIKVIRKNNEG